MTRIELANSAEQEREELKQELKKELKEKKQPPKVVKKRSCLSCRSCCSFLVLIVLALLFFILMSLAKTGLFQIPFFSDIFYKIPEPVHIVESKNLGVEEIEKLSQSFLEGVREQALEQIDAADLKKGFIPPDETIDLSLDISEEELTSLINYALSSGQNSEYKLEDSQLAVTPEGLQFFSHVLEPRDFYITADFLPEVKEEKFDLKLEKIKIGVLSLPSFLSDIFSKYFLSSKIQEIVEDSFLLSKIESLELSKGKVNIYGSLKAGDLQDFVVF